jgi:hypothetical protein
LKTLSRWSLLGSGYHFTLQNQPERFLADVQIQINNELLLLRHPLVRCPFIPANVLSEGSRPETESSILFSFEVTMPEGEGPASRSKL